MDTNHAPSIEQLLGDNSSDEAKFRNVLVNEMPLSSKLKNTFWGLGEKGWNREKFYAVAHYIQFNDNLTDYQHDAIAEFLLNVIGECQLKFVWKLPDEPQTFDGFEKYFRGKEQK